MRIIVAHNVRLIVSSTGECLKDDYDDNNLRNARLRPIVGECAKNKSSDVLEQWLIKPSSDLHFQNVGSALCLYDDGDGISVNRDTCSSNPSQNWNAVDNTEEALVLGCKADDDTETLV